MTNIDLTYNITKYYVLLSVVLQANDRQNEMKWYRLCVQIGHLFIILIIITFDVSLN